MNNNQLRKFVLESIHPNPGCPDSDILKKIHRDFPKAVQFVAPDNIIKCDFSRSQFERVEHAVVFDRVGGQTNAHWGIPGKSASLAIYQTGKCTGAVIYDTATRRHYSLEQPEEKSYVMICQDLGSLSRLERHEVPNLKNAVIGSSAAEDVRALEIIPFWSRLAGKTAALRVTGAPVLDFVLLASGSLHGYIGHNMKPWQLGAAMPIARAMGVKVTNWHGEEATIFDDRILAAPTELHEELFKTLFYTNEK